MLEKEKSTARKSSASRAPKRIKTALGSLAGKPVIITFHSLGDLDACAGALALARFLGPQALVAPPDRTNSESRRLLGNELAKAPSFDQARKRFPSAPIVLIDANDRSLLPQFANTGNEQNTRDGKGATGARAAGDAKNAPIFLLIDHHALGADSIRADNEWVDPTACSVCEMICPLVEPIDPESARWLVWGILSDSAGLMRADARTFVAMAKLLERSDRSYEDLRHELSHPAAATARAAVLEGLRQSVWLEKDGLVVAMATVSSHESHVADALVNAGADAAFAGTQDRKGARISARLRPALSSRLDLPKLMEEVGKTLGGNGGGHPCAAGASGPRWDRLEGALFLAQRLFLERTRPGSNENGL